MDGTTVSSYQSTIQKNRKPMNSVDNFQTGMNVLKKTVLTSSFMVNACHFFQASPLIAKIISNGILAITSHTHQLTGLDLLVLNLLTLLNVYWAKLSRLIGTYYNRYVKPLTTPSNQRFYVFHIPKSHNCAIQNAEGTTPTPSVPLKDNVKLHHAPNKKL